MPVDTQARLAKLYTRATDTVLAESLRTTEQTIDNHTEPTSQDAQARRLIRSWLIAELERRHPEANTVLEAVFDAATDHEDRTGEYVDVDYAATLLAAINL